ncbi:RNA polymerase sigma-70 factor (ECF subfamily) [Stella humosa]|uniref:RNA polymerase sigma-70 factor (ECF subfamily) n=1 Tax=Stella humosa TaxID=94 RepID=A0A3N1MBH6_9PROT|nr:RNA polymerase sigma-70 factor (ECF subfamily) [Stella humosa]BBK30352.1 RNA polymerase sigma factor [Stella humosa]
MEDAVSQRAANEREAQWSAWMRAADDGDDAAYRRFLEALAPAIRSVVRQGMARAGAGSGDIEDVVQETLLAIHLKRDSWDRASPIGPWINAIARYKTVDALRRQGRRAEAPLDDVVEAMAAPAAEDGLARRDAERALATLEGRTHQVVRAISLEGAGIGETARRLGITEGAVRVALHRGLKALARRFGGEDR